ncbi:hypothetical protein ACFQPF_05500 [Fictibacillus iocasae]|uniref:Uncharacterized protein n=1 Tax=Fictibacillus iocasae TaxID=2715437 RepID=A0ABW2NKD8_9BACL
MEPVIGWLDPEGTFYECKYGDHKILAQELTTNKVASSPQDDLWERSFINITTDVIGWNCQNKPTDQQIAWLLSHEQNFDSGQLEDLAECRDFYKF